MTQQVRGRVRIDLSFLSQTPKVWALVWAVGPGLLGYSLQLLNQLPWELHQIKPIRLRTAFSIQFNLIQEVFPECLLYARCHSPVILQCLCQLSLGALYTLFRRYCLSNIEIVNVKDILKIAINAKAFWIQHVDVKKKKKELDLNKRKLAAVVLSVLQRKQLYLMWSKMSQGCLHGEEINAMEVTWLFGNEKPKCKKGVEGRRRLSIENYTERVLSFCLSLPHMCTLLFWRSHFSETVLPLISGDHSKLTQPFVLITLQKTAKGTWYMQTSDGFSEAQSIVNLLRILEAGRDAHLDSGPGFVFLVRL